MLCSGVLYHLPDMLRALWAIRAYVKSELLLETLVTRKHEDGPFAEYLPATSCNNDPTNFWAPNAQCVQEMLRDCGFTVTETILYDSRGFFRATFNPAPDAGDKMLCAVLTVTYVAAGVAERVKRALPLGLREALEKDQQGSH